MVIHYIALEIPILCVVIVLWVFCCHFAKKHSEAELSPPPRPAYSPSVYVIPIQEEEREEEEDEEVMAEYEAYFQPRYSDPPMYCSGDVSPPPPYRLEPPTYLDPPPSYTDPPPYSEQP
ncbi:extensin-like [Plectropomus leopardus]|uniref:extensin-like n=1 Tax=Plectropomus leopardus TaxID=160734 RepID=UPI001C4A805E|nr:extensin-like [Plectropomus leopardus]